MLSRLLLSLTFVVFVVVLGTAYFTLPRAQTAVITIDPALEAASVTPTGTAATPTAGSTAPGKTTTTQNGYTMAKVAQHNSASSCWSVINGNVYNLTSWINLHPGGPEVILALCGTDGSDGFNGQHGGARRPASELAGFLLGPLTK